MLRIYVVIFMAVLTGTLSSGWIAVSSVRSSNGPVEEGDSLLVMFWNIENMFDYRDSGTGESDTEFSSFGQRRWTKSRFYAKCNAIAKSVLWIADSKGRLPDVIGFAEVENAFAVRSIIGATALKKCGYSMVHFDSPDSRGIDVALLYRDDVFEKLSARSCHIYGEYDGQSDGRDSGPEPVRVQQEQEKSCCDNAECGIRQAELMGTRDILLVSLKHRTDGLTYHFLVNHHPSKYGGAKASEGRRRIAMRTLRNLCDSLSASGESKSAAVVAGVDDIAGPAGDGDVRIIAMGDFNDTPSGGPFDILCGGNGLAERDHNAMGNSGGGQTAPVRPDDDWRIWTDAERSGFGRGRNVMVNLGDGLEDRGEGTIRYGGKWELIDMFIVSRSLAGQSAAADCESGRRCRMEVVRIPFLMTRDNTHVGDRPLRTYSGPRYLGGVSDHCPIILTVSN